MTVAVLGGGAGARAAAGEMALAGWQVRMWDLPEFHAGLQALKAEPVLQVTGVVEGSARLAAVCADVGEAVAGAEVIFVVTQALGHAPMAEALAGVIGPEQVIVVMPGSSGGALQVRHIMNERTGVCPTVAETSTLPWAARCEGERGVRIVHRVGLVKLAALPAGETARLAEVLRPVMPGVTAAGSVLETMLSNGNPVIHPAVMLLNAGTVERCGGQWEFYEEGVTPAVAEVIRAVDQERLALGRATGVELLPEPEMSRRQGYSESADYLRAYRVGPGFQKLGGPASLQHRYLTEDVACGMVTWLELADVFEVPMPVCAALVQLTSVVLGRDLRQEAQRGLRALGLEGMTSAELVACLAGR